MNLATPTDAVTTQDIRDAAARLRGHVVRTPLLPVPWTGSARPLWLKPESLQPTGALKLRGAFNAVAMLDQRTRARGVVTFSSGNHAQALAWSARAFGVPAVVVMRSDAPHHKIEATRRLGADVLVVSPGERKARTVEVATERGMTIVAPFDDPHIIAGHGTAGMEIATDISAWNRHPPHPDTPVSRAPTGHGTTVLVPAGGGGMLAGIAIALKALLPDARILGVEPELSADLAESFATDRRVEWDIELTSRTIADGVRASVGEFAWGHIRRHVDGVVTVSEVAILEATAQLVRRSRIVAEPTGALTTAAYLEHADRFQGTTTIAVVSGGNVSPQLLGRLLGDREGGIVDNLEPRS